MMKRVTSLQGPSPHHCARETQNYKEFKDCLVGREAARNLHIRPVIRSSSQATTC